jgi:hypothetical protein
VEGIEIGDPLSADWTAATAISVVAEITHSAMRSSGNSRMRIPRPAWA